MFFGKKILLLGLTLLASIVEAQTCTVASPCTVTGRIVEIQVHMDLQNSNSVYYTYARVSILPQGGTASNTWILPLQSVSPSGVITEYEGGKYLLLALQQAAMSGAATTLRATGMWSIGTTSGGENDNVSMNRIRKVVLQN